MFKKICLFFSLINSIHNIIIKEDLNTSAKKYFDNFDEAFLDYSANPSLKLKLYLENSNFTNDVLTLLFLNITESVIIMSKDLNARQNMTIDNSEITVNQGQLQFYDLNLIIFTKKQNLFFLNNATLIFQAKILFLLNFKLFLEMFY